MMNSYNIKRFLFATILLLFVVAFVQQKLRLKYEWPLSGAVTYTDQPVFNFKSWFDGSYQQQFEKYTNENFGFRNYFVRLNNQIAFTFFKQAKANGVVIGKENYLYEVNYINAIYGKDSSANTYIDSQLQKVKFLQDTLKKLNIDLILVFAPGKADYLPEFVPDNLKPAQTHRTNFSYYLKKSNELGLNHIDFHSYFKQLKPKTSYPLYPQYGIHWSSYGRDIALDSIVHYIEHLKGIDMNNLSFTNLQLSDSLRESDYDIGDGMNLLFKLKTFPMAYQQIVIENNPSKVKPKLLTIADSYWWPIYNLNISESLFSNGKFWFYNKQVYPESFTTLTLTSQLNLKTEIESRDVILLMATDATLPTIGWGFIDNAYDLYTYGSLKQLNKDPAYIEKVKGFIYYIKTQPEWFDAVKKQALQNKISVDSMLMLNAIYTLEHSNH